VTVVYPAAPEHVAACRWLDRLGARPVTYTGAVSFAVMDHARWGHVLGFDQDFVAAGFSVWS
jgi:predicted nucleic acid-binding protein